MENKINLDDIDEEETGNIMCEFDRICPLHKYSMKCIFKKENCRGYKFYRKYKEFDYGRYLGI